MINQVTSNNFTVNFFPDEMRFESMVHVSDFALSWGCVEWSEWISLSWIDGTCREVQLPKNETNTIGNIRIRDSTTVCGIKLKVLPR